jgi:hypothetical protein
VDSCGKLAGVLDTIDSAHGLDPDTQCWTRSTRVGLGCEVSPNFGGRYFTIPDACAAAHGITASGAVSDAA